jgi:hypothetical protein
MSRIEVVAVADRPGLAAFIAAGRRGQAGNPRWVEPLHDEVFTTFDARRAPFLRENRVQPFVAFRDGEPVGRIVATVATAHLEKFHDGCGFFGFLDAIDDPRVFDALFAAAEGFLRGQGMRLARGPFSLTVNHESGLLVDGFDAPHVVRTNHAPPHYAAHVERLGYKKAMDLVAYVGRVAESDLPERAARAFRKTSDPEIAIHNLSLRTWGRDFARVLALYNDAWADNAFSTPVSAAEAKFIAKLTLPACRPSWIHIATHAGEDVAVVVQIPDANAALSGLDGRLLPFGFARFLWRVHVAGVKRTRVVMMGVARKWRNTRVAVRATGMLAAQVIADARKAGVEEVEYSWVLETNAPAVNMAKHVPARLSRTFRVYERELSDPIP